MFNNKLKTHEFNESSKSRQTNKNLKKKSMISRLFKGSKKNKGADDKSPAGNAGPGPAVDNEGYSIVDPAANNASTFHGLCIG